MHGDELKVWLGRTMLFDGLDEHELGRLAGIARNKTLATGEAYYFSRSRNELWHKGATSGQIQLVEEILVDCDQDALLLKVTPEGDGGACHTGARTCFYRAIEGGKLVPRP